MTTEELRTLKECQYNAIVRRGVPFSICAASGAYLLIRLGILKKTKLHLAVSGISGFITGIMSYRQTCIDKLLALPNSTLKEKILAAQKKHSNVR